MLWDAKGTTSKLQESVVNYNPLKKNSEYDIFLVSCKFLRCIYSLGNGWPVYYEIDLNKIFSEKKTELLIP